MRALAIFCLLVLAGCGTKPATQDSAQFYFDSACAFANKAIPLAEPLVPVITAKLGDDGKLAVQSGLTFIKSACSKPLDITNAAAVTQRLYDVGGQILEIVLKAQQA